jgi:hypothetical protein
MLFHHVAMEARTFIDAQNARHATYDTTDSAADDRANRSGGAFTFPRAALNSARYTLRLRHHRHCDDSKERCGSDQTTIHEYLLCTTGAFKR